MFVLLMSTISLTSAQGNQSFDYQISTVPDDSLVSTVDVAIAIDKVQFDSPRIVMVHITNANNNESVFYKTVNIRHISGVEADPEGIFTVDATDFGFDIQDIAKGTYRMKVKVFLQNGDVKSKDEILNW